MNKEEIKEKVWNPDPPICPNCGYPHARPPKCIACGEKIEEPPEKQVEEAEEVEITEEEEPSDEWDASRLYQWAKDHGLDVTWPISKDELLELIAAKLEE